MPARKLVAAGAQLEALRVEVCGTAAARRKAPSTRVLRQWVQAALGRRARGAELALRVVGAAESRRLNSHYRGKDQPTNVLSFPAPARLAKSNSLLRRPLGDLLICAALLVREARRARKPLRAHWAHLVVHGSLHLAGYDHQRVEDASRL